MMTPPSPHMQDDWTLDSMRATADIEKFHAIASLESG